MAPKTKIVFADGQLLFRKSLKSLLNAHEGFEVIAEADNGRSLLDILKLNTVDLVLLDNEIPAMDCKSILQIISYRFTGVKVIVLSKNHKSEHISDFIGNGANCYLSKNCELETLYQAIKVVMKDGYYIDNTLYKVMLNEMVHGKPAFHKTESSRFNAKEINIMKEICDGKTNKQIAQQLNISASTVDFYKSKIYSKSNCRNVTELLKFALRRGIVTL